MAETITKNTKITYKKSRNPRKVKLWESLELTSIMLTAVDIKDNLERMQSQMGFAKPTLINSEMLYVLVGSYIDNYNRLLEESLIKTGNIKHFATIH